jgi:hypothetical protein
MQALATIPLRKLQKWKKGFLYSKKGTILNQILNIQSLICYTGRNGQNTSSSYLRKLQKMEEMFLVG